jgi:hypothetical protein
MAHSNEADSPEPPEGLCASFVIEYSYRRSTGPVIGRFLEGLRDQKILGARCPDGRVLVPAREYDPKTGDAISDLVQVGPLGTIKSWTWVSQPLPQHAMPGPFAWALILLDGANTALLHRLEVNHPDAIHAGLRVRPRWSEERTGSILDIQYFEPASGEAT